jgi:cell division protein FtsA
MVLTGGGAMMKHIQQLAAFKTGLDVRIGYPNEYLANDTADELASPMCSTGVGLVIEGMSRYEEALKHGKATAGNDAFIIEEDEPTIDLTATSDSSADKEGNKFFHRIVTSLGKKFFGEDEEIDNEKI